MAGIALASWVVGCGFGSNPAQEVPSDGRLVASGAKELPEAYRCPEGRRADPPCFRSVAGGKFLMGAQSVDPAAPGFDPAAGPLEGPVREVTVEPYWMMSWLVPAGKYRECVEAGWCSDDAVMPRGPLSTIHDHAKDYLPAVGVSWAGAQRLCAWFGGRLPTEAEWELAARGTEGRRWAWGDTPRCPQTVSGLLREGVVPGSLAPAAAAPADLSCAYDGPTSYFDDAAATPQHFSGMGGNVFEWTLDGFVSGDAGGGLKAQRGGSYMSTDPLDARTTVRNGMDPEARLPDVGFRCVWTGRSDG